MTLWYRLRAFVVAVRYGLRVRCGVRDIGLGLFAWPSTQLAILAGGTGFQV